MTKRLIYLFVAVAALWMVGCGKPDLPTNLTPKITVDSLLLDFNKATFTWQVDYPGMIGSMVQVGTEADLADAISYGSDQIADKKQFKVEVDSLIDNKNYYYRHVVWNHYDTYMDEVKKFVFHGMSSIITTSQVTNITQTTATCGGVVSSSYHGLVVERGVCWSNTHNPTMADNHGTGGAGTGSFSVNLVGLTANTLYYVRAYAKLDDGFVSYGEEVSFITLPIVRTLRVVEITQTTALAEGEVDATIGDGTVPERGFCWSFSHDPTINGAHATSGVGTGRFSMTIVGLSAAKTYYLRSYAKNNMGLVAYGEELVFSTLPPSVVAPTGAINGLFSVSETQQVYFSQGNLQYNASSNIWQFAENQWDYNGEANANISQSFNGWIDMFGWGTSGYNHGASSYQPWSTSKNNNTYLAYGQGDNNLYDKTGMADWGYNAISNGGDLINIWRTPTYEEWKYVFYTRDTPSGIRFVKAVVNDVNGLILLPDDWNSNYYQLNAGNSGSADFSVNTIPAVEWASCEMAGAVFLPVTGYRNGTELHYIGSRGYYWSSSICTSTGAWGLYIGDVGISTDEFNNRFYGYSVRLVHNVQ